MPGLACQGMAIVVIPKCHPPANSFTENKRVKVRLTACHYATKKRPVKIAMYLGLNIIIILKFTITFDKCAMLNVLNCMNKNFEPG